MERTVELSEFSSYGKLKRWFKNRPQLVVHFRTAGWLMADKVFRIVAGVLVGAWVARYLGPSEYGDFAYALTFVAFFSVVASLGLDGIVIRDAASNPEISSTTLGTVLRLRLAIASILWAVSALGMTLLEPGIERLFWLSIILGGTMVFQAFDTLELWFVSQAKGSLAAMARIAACLIGAAFKVWMILTQQSLHAFAIVISAEGAITACFFCFLYRSHKTSTKWKWSSEIARKLLAESWPYLLSSLSIILYMRIDQIMIRKLVGSSELGIYCSAVIISSALYTIPTAISATFSPGIARLKEKNDAEFDRSIIKLFALMWWVCLPTALVASMVGGPMVLWLYGEAYAEAPKVIAIHAFSLIPVGLGIAQAVCLVNEKRGQLQLIRTILGCITSLFANLILVPSMGAKGAAVATLIAFSVASSLANSVLAPDLFLKQMHGFVLPFREWRRILGKPISL
jgi:O-antigen/teichoic acid export membrane protein